MHAQNSHQLIAEPVLQMVGNETIMTSSSRASDPPGFLGIHKQHLNIAQARLSDAFEVTLPAKKTDGSEGEFTTVVSKKVLKAAKASEKVKVTPKPRTKKPVLHKGAKHILFK